MDEAPRSWQLGAMAKPVDLGRLLAHREMKGLTRVFGPASTRTTEATAKPDGQCRGQRLRLTCRRPLKWHLTPGS